MVSDPLDLNALLAEAPDGAACLGATWKARRPTRPSAPDELERGLEQVTEERLAVFGSTADDPEKHFIGWRDDVDPDELFASGKAGHHGRAPTRRLASDYVLIQSSGTSSL